MNRTTQIICATVGVFVGSLLSDVWFGDGIQSNDINQAAMVAIVAGIIQLWLTRKKPQTPHEPY
ncbi:MAG: hypothetical protein V4500_03065 [Pseudomonadota bacterium]